MATFRFLRASALSATVAAGSVALAANVATAKASDGLHPPHLPWGFTSLFGGYDKASVRRGYLVFTEVCQSCHSIDRLAFRNLVGVAFTENEAKEAAAKYEVPDEPDANGEERMRPAKLSDHMPGPYKNEQEARAANAGALPPDLSVITKARHGGADYVFALLTGYRTAPKGLEVPGGLYYNPYFPGGGIAMAQKLFDDAVEYDDGTPQTQSQYAKDVSEFLAWLGEPELEDRKRTGFKFLAVMTLLLFPALYVKRFKYSVIKTRVVKFVEPKNWKN